MLTVLLSFCAFVFFLKFYLDRREIHRVFKRMGIPGPNPNFLFGNILSLADKKGFHKLYQRWTKKFGRTYGYFEGPTPVLVTSDPDVIQEVFVKQFHNFYARKPWPVQADPEVDERVHMFFAKGDRWRRLRSVVSPAFSSKKMREMTLDVGRKVEDMVGVVTNSKEKVIDILSLFQSFTLDSIANCAFGIESKAVLDVTEPFLTHCRGVIKDATSLPFLYLCGFLFPALHRVWICIFNALHYVKFNPVFWLEEKMMEIIEDRKQTEENTRMDLLQLMIDARIEGFLGSKFSTSNMSKKELGIQKKLSNEEIVQQALLFMLAGFETTSTTLAYLFHELAKNPDIQAKLREEIDEHFLSKDEKPTYDNVRKLKYLDMIIKETLRKHPVASVVIARKCINTCVVKGMTIPEGMVIQADVWSLHRDSEVWGEGDLEEFLPERFTKENSVGRHPCAWIPFGAGPRMCAGLRFANLKAKMATVALVKNFQVQHAEGYQMQVVEGATIAPKNGVMVNAIPID